MAFLPCDRGHTNPRGRNQLVYSAWGTGSDFSRFRIRLCQAHAQDVYRNLAQFELDPETGQHTHQSAFNLCIACNQPVNDDFWQVFATCYPTNDDRVDYWARLHPNCRFPDWLINTGDNGYLPSQDPTDIGRPRRAT